MNLKWVAGIVILALASQPGLAIVTVGFQEYVAAVDDVSGSVQAYGQLIVQQQFDVQLREVVRDVPVFSIRYAGRHHREGPANDPAHARARAKCIAERLVHAWTLMDHGAKLEIAVDDWTKYEVGSRSTPANNTAIFIRSPVPGSEPLRIVTVYPEDVAGYPWISNERSLAQYLAALIQSHYFLFWRNESDINRYEELRIDKSREGKIFKEAAMRALETARLKNRTQFDAAILKDALARMTVSQREGLYRLAITPPLDWESSSQ